MMFDEQLRYTPDPTLRERIAIGKITLTKNQQICFIVAIALTCVILPIAVLVFTNFNFVLSGVTFVIADFLCELAHCYWSIISPHKTQRQEPLAMAKQKIKDWESKMASMQDQYQNQEMKDMDDLAEVPQLSDDIDNLSTYLKYEKTWIDEKLTAYKKEELASLQKPAKDYEEKKLFFLDFKERLEMYISLYKFDYLQVVLQSITDLIQVLDRRPNGYDLIPTMFYIYIEELQKIITKMSEREQEQVRTHLDDLKNVSNALSKNINRMIERIHESEATEIDISLSVLLKELNGEDVFQNA